MKDAQHSTDTGRESELLELLARLMDDYLQQGIAPPEGEPTLIYNGRNQLYSLQHGGESYVVKCFGRLAWWQRLLYSLPMMMSKAKRSHLYSLELERRGIGVAQSLGYVEERSALGLLSRSYHYSKLLPYTEAQIQPHARGWASPSGFMQGLAHFAHSLHKAGVEHLDLSPGNVLYRYTEGEGYTFYLVDLNRMRLHERPLTQQEVVANMVRLMNTASTTRQLAQHYAEACGWAVEPFVVELSQATDAFWQRRHLKLSYRYTRRVYGMGLCGFVWMYLRYRYYLSKGAVAQASELYRKYLQREDIRHIERQKRGFGYQYTD